MGLKNEDFKVSTNSSLLVVKKVTLKWRKVVKKSHIQLPNKLSSVIINKQVLMPSFD